MQEVLEGKDFKFSWASLALRPLVPLAPVLEMLKKMLGWGGVSSTTFRFAYRNVIILKLYTIASKISLRKIQEIAI